VFLEVMMFCSGPKHVPVLQWVWIVVLDGKSVYLSMLIFKQRGDNRSIKPSCYCCWLLSWVGQIGTYNSVTTAHTPRINASHTKNYGTNLVPIVELEGEKKR